MAKRIQVCSHHDKEPTANPMLFGGICCELPAAARSENVYRGAYLKIVNNENKKKGDIETLNVNLFQHYVKAKKTQHRDLDSEEEASEGGGCNSDEESESCPDEVSDDLSFMRGSQFMLMIMMSGKRWRRKRRAC